MRRRRGRRLWWAGLGSVVGVVGLAGLAACQAEAAVPGTEVDGLLLGGLVTLVVLAIMD